VQVANRVTSDVKACPQAATGHPVPDRNYAGAEACDLIREALAVSFMRSSPGPAAEAARARSRVRHPGS